MAVSLDLAHAANRPRPAPPVMPMAGDEKPSLVGLDRAALGEALSAVGVPDKQIRMRVAQLWHWLYVRGVADFSQMANVAGTLR